MADIKEEEVIVVAAAVKKTAGGFTYMGINVGSYITDDECRQVATAAITALDSLRAAKTI